jgi:flagella basal body P-ring formation protein FlgA
MMRAALLIDTALVAMVAIALDSNCLAQDAPGPVSITLREKAVVSKCCVRLGEIAELDGGPEILRKRMADLDVDELSSTENQAHICPRSQVQFRLRLAAIPVSYFNLGGARDVAIVLRPQSLSPAKIEEAAKEDLYRRLPWSRDDLSVQLLRPISATMPAMAEDEALSLEVEPNRSNAGLGHVQMNVSIRVNGEQRLSLPVYFNVQMVQEVAVCRRNISAGETLTEGDLIRQRRPVGSNDAQVARPDSLIGIRLRRALKTGQIVAANDVDKSSSSALLVQPHQPVRMTVHLGPMDVVAIGEAMEGGPEGKLIRVRNIETKAIVTGRVTGPRTVEVDSGIH